MTTNQSDPDSPSKSDVLNDISPNSNKAVVMDITNPVIQTIIKGTQAEYAKKSEEACAFYQQAWDMSKNAYEFSIAAHYVARCQKSAKDRFHWNQIALDQANSILQDSRITPLLPSLYLNMGQSHAQMGNFEQSDYYFQEAAALGFPHLESNSGETLG